MSIKLATLDEQVEVFSEPCLLAILPDSPTLRGLRDYLVAAGNEFFVVTYGKYSMLFEFYPYRSNQSVYEVHVVCPLAHRRASRAMSLMVVQYIFETKPHTLGLITTCPEGKMANMCRKTGAIKIGVAGDHVVMFATKEQLIRK